MGSQEKVAKLKEMLAQAEIEAELDNRNLAPEEDSVLPPFPNERPQPRYEEQARKQTGTEVYSTIPKKTAALEIINRYQKIRAFIVFPIAAPFIILISNIFNSWAGVAAAVIAIVPSAILFYNINNEIKILKYEYGIR